MSTETKIEWTDHTFNAWWGCTKVHAGCSNCYAEAWDQRWGGDHWGKNKPRRFIKGEWTKPLQWNAEARKRGVRARVFCSSMCDIFEKYDGPIVDREGAVIPELSLMKLRLRVFELIEKTPWLVWLLLTKRPENIVGMSPNRWHSGGHDWPDNVWTGTSPCDQETADVCVPALVRVPGPHFLSCEPLLGEIDLEKCGAFFPNSCGCTEPDYAGPIPDPKCAGSGAVRCIDWVIVGGESEQRGRVRDFPVDAAEKIVRQCEAASVPVFMKQFGRRPTFGAVPYTINGRELGDKKGGDMAEWPKWARVRQIPEEMRRTPSVPTPNGGKSASVATFPTPTA